MKRFLMLGLALFCTSVSAQFPAKPVRIIVPYTPGGGTDIISRALAARMQESWGQQVLVENRPGANGIIGTEVMVKSPADGHVVAMVVVAHVVNAVLQ
jgi:tripartite-type tricarboxylate transporter receptor subunit TctC